MESVLLGVWGSHQQGVQNWWRNSFSKTVFLRWPREGLRDQSYILDEKRSLQSRNNASKRLCPNIVERCCNLRTSYFGRDFWTRWASKIRKCSMISCVTLLVGSAKFFGEKIVLAKTSEELLRADSVWRNPTLLAGLTHDDDPSMQDIFFVRSCLDKVPGGTIFSQRSERATACTIRMQIDKQISETTN